MTTAKEIINFENVNLRYGWGDDEFHALTDVNLNIRAGEHCAILGANGSGKSTLIKLISSQLYPSIAEKPAVRKILGQDSWSIAKLRQHIGIVTNDLHNSFAVDGGYLDGFEMVMSGFFGTIGTYSYQDIKPEYEEQVYFAMEKVGITHLKNKKVSTMSTGQLRKCLVARALVHPLDAILLDEPTVGLDIKAQLDFIKMMQNLANGGTTVILVTHHIEEIFEEISKVILIKDGHILAQGKKADILTSDNISKTFDVNVDLVERSGRYSLLKR